MGIRHVVLRKGVQVGRGGNWSSQIPSKMGSHSAALQEVAMWECGPRPASYSIFNRN